MKKAAKTFVCSIQTFKHVLTQQFTVWQHWMTDKQQQKQ